MPESVLKTASAAWQGTGRACVSLIRLIVPTFVLLVAVRLGLQATTAGQSPVVLDGAVLATLLLDLLIATPLAMAVYRLHLLGERGGGQVFSDWLRLWRFFRGLFLIEAGALLVTSLIVAGLIFWLVVIAVIAHIHVARPIARLGTIGTEGWRV